MNIEKFKLGCGAHNLPEKDLAEIKQVILNNKLSGKIRIQKILSSETKGRIHTSIIFYKTKPKNCRCCEYTINFPQNRITDHLMGKSRKIY